MVSFVHIPNRYGSQERPLLSWEVPQNGINQIIWPATENQLCPRFSYNCTTCFAHFNRSDLIHADLHHLLVEFREFRAAAPYAPAEDNSCPFSLADDSFQLCDVEIWVFDADVEANVLEAPKCRG